MTPTDISSDQATARAARLLPMGARVVLEGRDGGFARATTHNPSCGLDHAQPPRSGDCGLLSDVLGAMLVALTQRRHRVCSTPWTDLNVHRARSTCSTKVRIEACGRVVEPAGWIRVASFSSSCIAWPIRGATATSGWSWDHSSTSLGVTTPSCWSHRPKPSRKPSRRLEMVGPLIEERERERHLAFSKSSCHGQPDPRANMESVTRIRSSTTSLRLDAPATGLANPSGPRRRRNRPSVRAPFAR